MKYKYCFALLFLGAMSAFSADCPKGSQELVNSADAVAIVSIGGVPPPGFSDSAVDTPVSKQITMTKVERCIVGSLPNTIWLANQRDSVLAKGTYMAFLNQVGEGAAYILSSKVSLRRIREKHVYWFSGYEELEKVITEVRALHSVSGIHRLHAEAEEFYKIGRNDLAKKRCAKILALAPGNNLAMRMLKDMELRETERDVGDILTAHERELKKPAYERRPVPALDPPLK